MYYLGMDGVFDRHRIDHALHDALHDTRDAHVTHVTHKHREDVGPPRYCPESQA